jgi:RNA polymerase sigma-70 factor (family 1)
VGFSDHIISDTALTTLLRDGDHKAFAQLYHQYSGKLYLNVLKMVKDEQVAEELIQELFAKIWHKRADLKIDTDFLAYLYRSAQNLVHDFFRKLQRDKKMRDHFVAIAVSHYQHIEEGLHYRESEGILKEAIENLSPQQRNVYQFCKIDGGSYKEAAEELGISVHTVKEYLVKANKEVKSYLLTHLDASFGVLFFMILKDRIH